MSKPDNEAAALAEYAAIKAEQTARIGWRDNLLYVTLAAVGTILAFAHRGGYLLLVPAVTTVLGWNYLANDQMISAIGRYFREHSSLPLGWESEHPADDRRRQRKAIQLAVDVATFVGAGMVALIAFWVAPEPPALIVASVAEVLALCVLAWQFAAYAGVSLGKRTP